MPLGFLPGRRRECALARARPAARPGAAARQVARRSSRPDADDLGRAGERTAVRASRRASGSTPSSCARVDALGRRDDGKRPGTPPSSPARCGWWPSSTCASSRRSRSRGLGRAAFVLVANTDPYTYAGSIPIHVAPEARFELGLDLVAPERVRGVTLPRLLRHVLHRPRARARARAALRRTTSTGSRSPATGRCRCRPTARISATSRAPSSRPSAAQLRCLSRVRP